MKSQKYIKRYQDKIIVTEQKRIELNALEGVDLDQAEMDLIKELNNIVIDVKNMKKRAEEIKQLIQDIRHAKAGNDKTPDNVTVIEDPQIVRKPKTPENHPDNIK